jgi:AcrR family transcriptional regulator
MSEAAIDGPRLTIIHKIVPLFLAQGYYPVTMTGIADACGLTRRALYHHFRSKEDVLRVMLVAQNRLARDTADWAAQKTMARGGSALEVVSEWLDSRFGNTRRNIARAPGGEDLNRAAFSIANDILIEVSRETNARLTALLEELCRRGKLRLKPGRSAAELAEIIADGARGVNQQRPSIPASEIAPRYRRMAEAILYGIAHTGRPPRD